jgi:hypothetical protein
MDIVEVLAGLLILAVTVFMIVPRLLAYAG